MRRFFVIGWFIFSMTRGLALAAPPVPGTPPEGFRLEPKPTLDDVFGDVSAYRKVVDRFGLIAEQMQQHREEFARAVQAVLLKLQPPMTPGEMQSRPRVCRENEIAGFYVQGLRAGQDYLRTGRELTRLYEHIRELDRLGETIGLTPDYRWKVKRMMAQYQTLLTDYREMKVAFHDQLANELRYAGCNAERLLVHVDAGIVVKDEAWPNPGQAGAPGVLPPPTVVSAVEKPPAEKLPTPPVAALHVPSGDVVDRSAGLAPPAPRSGIIIYIDNTRCKTPTQASLDDKPAVLVGAATRLAIETTPGPHDLCLISQGSTQKCGSVGTVRRAYLHEGWTISLRCE